MAAGRPTVPALTSQSDIESSLLLHAPLPLAEY